MPGSQRQAGPKVTLENECPVGCVCVTELQC